MPLAQVTIRRGRPTAERAEIANQIYEALRETFDVPEGDRFVLIHERDDADISFDRHYPGMDRSDDLVIVQITVSNTRSREQKLALYRSINERLTRLGVRADDIMINLVEVVKENWSFGRGEAQYA